ncbi:MAG: heme oxygenase [Flavobacteriales bacterium]|nr:heme oxygenase [Flavobacteriales bacterium]
MNITERINKELELLKNNLIQHRLYDCLKTVKDVKTFTEYHVFAVWDFMSLLKSLQRNLTCIEVPWSPVENTNISRFVNEIVLEEESDVNQNGVHKSHFDMYLDAMKDLGADTSKISHFMNLLSKRNFLNYNKYSVQEALVESKVDEVVASFVNFTFSIIKTKKNHLIASVFTFGREGMIADMFIEILNKSKTIDNNSYESMIYYLKRHIELDGDEHGPIAMKMISELCGDDEQKIEETIFVAKEALKHRIKLWDMIADKINV